jgi:poly(3-hydroxybutyrate) depolymerase
MVRWLVDQLQSLRTWIAVRLGLWRGQWRHGVVQVSAAPFAFNPFVPHAWRYSLYTPGGLPDDSAAPLIIVLHGCRQRASSFAPDGCGRASWLPGHRCSARSSCRTRER